ncbi:VirB8/TrbF family protein [Sphingomonas sp. BK345]|uniref:VirB8/TrbF family protein n=1 Tax=Sphingomonas sp. BK345 TaxID=2586980 RepID=UPI00161AC5C7|nr:VirB8/TrbF family protein [Sphingomonas sp. BK345]MBB3475835.1 hypothetical protein [Sphingomonas sp. BK345]
MNSPQKIPLDSGLDDNTQLPDTEGRRLANTRSVQQLARARTLQNALIVVTILSCLVSAISMFGWMSATKRFAQNVRVAFVKMAPNGSTQVEYYEDGAESNRWFQATINKSLMDYVEHRYQEKHGTISYDWGYAMQFMSDPVQKQFVNGFNAAKVAAAFEASQSTGETEATVRAIDHDEIITPDGPKDDDGQRIVHSTIYLRLTKPAADGRVRDVENKILRVVWHFRPKSELNTEMLRANPLGIAITQERMTDDPTPVEATTPAVVPGAPLPAAAPATGAPVAPAAQ